MKRALFMLLATAACPSARAPNSECGEGAVVIEGACVSYRVADAFCGKTAKPGEGGCVHIACGPGEALDVEHGFCLPESTVFLGVNHAPPAYDETKRRAKCAHGWLANKGSQYSCTFGKLSCGRGQRWVKEEADAGPLEWSGKCAAQPVCGVGEIFDELADKCAKVVLKNGVIDVGAWARLAIGTDTGEGTNAFCAPVRQTGASARFQIELRLPDNDVTRATARLSTKGPVPATATDAAEHALEDLVQTLHFQAKSSGNEASAASVSLEVGCSPPQSAPPTLENVETRDGGHL